MLSVALMEGSVVAESVVGFLFDDRGRVILADEEAEAGSINAQKQAHHGNCDCRPVGA